MENNSLHTTDFSYNADMRIECTCGKSFKMVQGFAAHEKKMLAEAAQKTGE